MPSVARLLPTEPIGIDTTEIESLGSFLLRLSETNGASPRRIVEWICAKNDIPDVANSILASSPATLVRPNYLNARFAYALAKSTGFSTSIIERMTFYPLIGVVQRSPKCFDEHFKWCSACTAESVRSRTEFYFRLYWSFSNVSLCAIHHTNLTSFCPACESRQFGWRIRLNIGHCIRCGADLGADYDGIQKGNSWNCDSADLLDLCEVIAKGETHQFKEDGARLALQGAFDAAWHREEELEYYKKIPRDECLAFLHSNKPISLTTARRLAARTGIPLVETLRGNGAEYSNELSYDWRSKLPANLAPMIRVPRIDKELAAHGIIEALDDADRLSLRQVARRLRISPGGLAYHFPNESRRISERYKGRLDEEKRQKRNQAKAAVRTAIEEWTRNRADSPTKKGLLKQLFPSSGIPKHVLITAISEAVDAVDFASSNQT